MRWPRVLRWVVALVGLACAVALFVYSRHRTRAAARLAPVITDTQATSQQVGVKGIRWNLKTGDKEQIEISADLQTEYADGRTVWKNARIVTTRDGHRFEMRADAIETKGKAVTGDQPGEFTLTGSIEVKTEDGLDLKTDAATYDNINGIARIPGKMTFTRGRVSGDGVGANYERAQNLLTLLDQAHVAQAADEHGAGAVDATARTIAIARNDKMMTLTDAAKVTRAENTLAADTIVAHFTDDENGVRQIEMHAHASVTPAAASTNSPEMSADEITLEFQPDGSTLRHGVLTRHARLVQTGDRGRQTITGEAIDLVTAPDGHTLTNLQAKQNVEVVLPPTAEAPGRTIRAPSLVASGDDKIGLKVALFEGDVVFLEHLDAANGKPAVDRTGRSKRLTLDLNGQLGAISSAEFRETVKFKDGDLNAESDIANYDDAKGTMLLTPSKGSAKAPVVDDGSVKVDASSILITLDTHDLVAKDKVHSRMVQSKNGGDTHAPALFDSDKPVNGQASELTYVSKTKAARFVGSQARVYQDGGGYIFGDAIDLEQETGNLSAKGTVTSSFMLDTAGDSARGRGAAPKPQPTTGAAQTFVYKDAERRAIYSSEAPKLSVLRGPDGTIEAQQIVLTLQKEQRALQTLEATDAVWASFDEGRETISSHLTYDASTETYTLTGNPMHFKSVDTKEGQKSCSHETLTVMTYNQKNHSTTAPAAPGRPLKATEQMACTTPLKSVLKK